MTTIVDVSSKLGEFMLKGWILTDSICTKCSKVPVMKSPAAATIQTRFCVNCDAVPSSSNSQTPTTTNTSPSAPSGTASQIEHHSQSSVSNSTGISRSSTPLTEVSEAPSSPLLAPVLDTTELLRRRQQSDTASAEIGRRMLKGWAMLADECPNSDCYGIPLVRPPKTGAAPDPRKECVICAAVYVDERDAFGRDRLVQMHQRSRREPTVASSPEAALRNDGGTTNGHAVPLQTQLSAARQVQQANVAGFDRPPDHPALLNTSQMSSAASSTASALEATARSLEKTLLALSDRLNACSGGPVVDPVSITQTAEAISKTSQALTQVKQLLWSEAQALLG